MTALAVMVAAVLVATLQVAATPFFTVAGATADLGIAAILAALLVGGPRQAMLMTPAVALSVAFAGSRSPGLLLAGYAAVLPIGLVLERYDLPPTPYLRFLATALLSGAWLRGVLALGAFSGGAAFAPLVLLRDVITPGLAFDAVLLTLLYVPLRLSGRAQLRFGLERRGWLP